MSVSKIMKSHVAFVLLATVFLSGANGHSTVRQIDLGGYTGGIRRNISYQFDLSTGLSIYQPASNSMKTLVHHPIWWSLLTASPYHPHVISKKYVTAQLKDVSDETTSSYQTRLQYGFRIDSLQYEGRDKSIYSNLPGSNPYLDYSDFSTDLLIKLHRLTLKSNTAPPIYVSERLRLQVEATMQAMLERQDLTISRHVSHQGLDETLTGWLLINGKRENFNVFGVQNSCLLENGAMLSLVRPGPGKAQLIARVAYTPEETPETARCAVDSEIVLSIAKVQERQNDFLILVDDVLNLMQRTLEIGDRQ